MQDNVKINPAFTVPLKYRLRRPQPPLKTPQGPGWGKRACEK